MFLGMIIYILYIIFSLCLLINAVAVFSSHLTPLWEYQIFTTDYFFVFFFNRSFVKKLELDLSIAILLWLIFHFMEILIFSQKSFFKRFFVYGAHYKMTQ